MPNKTQIQQLTELGLSKYEARAYLALLGYDDSSAVEVALRSEVPRQRIYDVLARLRDRKLLVTRAGRPVRYTARDPASALMEMVEARRRQQQADLERLAALADTLISILSPTMPDATPKHDQQFAPSTFQEPVGGF